MLKKILLAIAVIIGILVVLINSRPNEFRLSRSAVVNAPPSAVFNLVNDFHNWGAWSPWAKLDPRAQYTYEGPQAGNGAIFRWAGNSQVGEGSNTIIDSRPNELIRIKLEFIKPFPGISIAEFTFQPQDKQTLVTWSMFGQNNFMAKAMGMFMNCDKIVGGQFEQGLANLKAVAEKK